MSVGLGFESQRSHSRRPGPRFVGGPLFRCCHVRTKHEVLQNPRIDLTQPTETECPARPVVPMPRSEFAADSFFF